MKLQGILPKSLRKYSGLPRGVLNGALGNAMSACVLERLLPQIAWATGSIPELMPDVWSCPSCRRRGARQGAFLPCAHCFLWRLPVLEEPRELVRPRILLGRSFRQAAHLVGA